MYYVYIYKIHKHGIYVHISHSCGIELLLSLISPPDPWVLLSKANVQFRSQVFLP